MKNLGLPLPGDFQLFHEGPLKHSAQRVTVVVPAAGRGSRMGGKRKQYRLLGGETLLVRTLRLFDEHPKVRSMVVAAPSPDLEVQSAELGNEGFRKLVAVVAGGASRQASVAAALEATPLDTDIVLVHDAVRPFLPPDRIDAVIEAAEKHGAAALALRAGDTLRRGDDQNFGETVSRSDLYRMQTPQGFRLEWIREAHAASGRTGHVETDDAGLVQRSGRKVRIVEGSPMNFKVTTPADWVIALALWHYLSAQV